MKNIILFLVFTISSFTFAQNYDKSWATVIEFENDGKIKSANREVESIYKKAYSTKNEIQIIKCFFYKSKYLQSLDENAQTNIISNLENEILKASVPAKAILNLIYAKCLNSYFNANRFVLYRRTKLDSTEVGNFLTWTQNDFETKIDILYREILQEEPLLKNTPIKNYEPIFDFFNLEKFNKTNLFDYLSQETIDYYSSKIPQIAYPEIDSKDLTDSLFGSNNEFKTTKLDSIKNEKIKKILLLYQKQNYQTEPTDLELDRLLFCNNYILKSDLKFLSVLNSFQKRASDAMLFQRILLEKAAIYNRLASKDKFPDYNIKAVSCLDSILKVTNKSNTFKKATLKKHVITLKSLNVQLQKQSYENENTRAFVTYKNCDTIKFSFYKIASNFENLTRNKDSIVEQVLSKNTIYKSQEYLLKNSKDYFEYTTEVILPILEIGTYLVLVESGKNEIAKPIYEIITVSNSSVLAYQNKDNSIYQILDRKTGKPIENCQIKSADFNLITNKDGVAQFDQNSKKNNNYNYRDIIVINGKDTLYLSGNYLNSFNTDFDENNKQITAKVNFYLDRAIYRPGQTVYYKGIAVQKQNGENKVIPNFLLHIVIEDDSNNEIKSFEVTTNEFGSFSGEFVLPKNGVTGEFSMEAEEPEDYENDTLFDKIEEEHPIWDNGNFEHSNIRFRVEEYKRPKFEITFEPIKENYLIKDKITVKGNAKAFAGSTICNAKVSYTIERSSNFYYKKNNSNNEGTIISSETMTDASGNFSIDFIALPEENYEQEKYPIFTYSVKADITDNNGETHSAETIVNVGRQCLKLKVVIPPKIASNEKGFIYLNSTNLNNQFVATNAELKIYFNKDFDRKFKKRVFQKPEISSISKDEFERLFPYENNDDPNSERDKGTLLYSKKINTDKDKSIALDFMSKYKSGYYKLVFSANDKLNNPLETSASFQLYQINDQKSTGNDLLTVRQLNENPRKDGFVLVQINSALPELYLSCYGIFNGTNFFEQNIIITNYKAEVKIPIETEIKDFFKIGLETIYDNQYFRTDKDIYIKEELPKISIEIETFRDKLEPGKTENWSFKIKEDHPKAVSEVLASMYDSSLDQFEKSYWEPLIARRYNYNHFYGKTPIGFEKIEIFLDELNPIVPVFEYQNEYTKLMWFGFDFNHPNNPYLIKEYKKQINKKAKKPANANMVTGIVTDGKLALPGANIIVKGTTRGTTADLEGNFEIEVAPGEVLLINFIGYNDKIITIGTDKTYVVSLKERAEFLAEVLVTGALGIKKKQNAVTSSSKVINFNGMGVASNSNAVRALAGKVSGLTITTSGEGVGANTRIALRGTRSITGNNDALIVIDGVVSNANVLGQMSADSIVDINVLKGAQGGALYGELGINGVVIVTTKKGVQELTQVKTRTNRNETAFFYPNLKTDAKGIVNFSFTSPEELTQWKLRLFAHNLNATNGYLEKSVVTQKELMVFPNMPRFLRENDTIVISAKVTNVTTNVKNGMAILQLFDATTMENIDNKMLNTNAVRNFTITPSGNTVVNWKITIPQGLQGVQYKVIAKADNYSDGEESILPVLTNTILVTESIPIWVREKSKKEYVFDNLKTNISSTLRNHQFTLEYTSNPSWIAIQSLPYLMEYEHECAEQTFARFYANTLATEIINSNPKIEVLFENWKKSGKLVSKLEQNEELKSLILAETPWMKDGENEEIKRKNLALLFDLQTMKTSSEATFIKLKERQKASGGFAWFDGGTESEYITRHIVAGLGHLQKLKVNKAVVSSFKEITKSAIPFLDSKFLENNKRLEKYSATNPYLDLHYLYARSFYLDSFPISKNIKTIINKQLDVMKSSWLNYSIYNKGLAALVLNRFGKPETAKKILESLKETSSTNEDWGMYWVENKSGWNWYQAPIETQALLIEAFSEIDHDVKSVDAMKVWLLKNKQVKNWPTTKSTTEAIYALLMQGSDWLSTKDNSIIKIGDEKILTKKLSENEKEIETGYLKLTWNSNEIKPEMASISIENKSNVPGFGGVYWQYFEDLDKIKTNNGGVLSTSKELYIKKYTVKGLELQRINATNPLKLGDLVTVRIQITAKEDLEYIHLKDMRASCFEPINVLSEYQWNDGLGYYRSTKDAATHFFFDKMNKGIYVLEYDVRVNNIGDFSNGITIIESMYAPEFTSHTKGIRVIVKN